MCDKKCDSCGAAPQPPSVGEPIGYVLTWNGEVYYDADDGVVISNTPGDELSERHKWVPVYTQPPSVGGEVEPLAYMAFAGNGNIRCWSRDANDRTLANLKEEGQHIVDLVDRQHITARDQQLAELKEAFEESQEELVSRGKQLAAQAKENEALRARVAELEELRKDAERYRWLCDGNGYFMEENSLCGHDNDKEEADAEIDAAMAKQVTKDDQ